MKRILLAVVGVLSVSASADAQSTAEMIERALVPAPTRTRDAVTVIKWNADYTYETLREGTNQMVCYDRSDVPGRMAFAAQCTVLGNLKRAAQNRRINILGLRQAERNYLLAAEEENGTRVEVVYGSVWIAADGQDQASARVHMTIAVPNATEATSGFSESPRSGGVWIMEAGTDGAHLMIPGR
jgi:ethanolamine utilization microcompartment shell protein EutL